MCQLKDMKIDFSHARAKLTVAHSELNVSCVRAKAVKWKVSIVWPEVSLQTELREESREYLNAVYAKLRKVFSRSEMREE